MSNILLTLILFINTYYYLTIFQQAHYDFLRLKKHHIVFLYTNVILIVSILFININIVILNLLLLIQFLILIIQTKRLIIPLKFTKRIVRFISCYLFINLLSNSVLLNFFELNICLYITNILIPILIFICNMILNPIEKTINKNYILSAKNIIEQNNNLIVIMITGSYGKTTIKNIIYSMVKKEYITVTTPKSYNTLLGICKVINSSVNSSTEILILEAGAAKLGDIEEICKVVKPDISVISEIGFQHLETFKSIENIIKEKFMVAEYLKEDGYLILNNDNKYIREKEIIKILDYNIIRINKNVNIISQLPKLIFEYDNKVIKTNLLGTHNIMNIILSLKVIDVLRLKGFNIEIEKCLLYLETMQPVKNRLEYKKINNINIYDDSYNSNYEGFKNAINLLSLSNNKKIIITPGIVDLGINSKSINEEIGFLIGQVFDEIYIVKNEVSKYLEKGLVAAKKEYYISNNFKEAYSQVVKQTCEIIDLLIENDLPDVYKER